MENVNMENIFLLLPEDIAWYINQWDFHTKTVEAFLCDINIDPLKVPYYEGVINYKKNGGKSWNDNITDEYLIWCIERFRTLFKSIIFNGYNDKEPISIRTRKKDNQNIILNGHHRAAIMYVLNEPIWATYDHELSKNDNWFKYKEYRYKKEKDKENYKWEWVIKK